MGKMHLVTVTKTAETEVDEDVAREFLVGTGTDVSAMSPTEIVEAYVSEVEGKELDLGFDRHVCAVTTLQG